MLCQSAWTLGTAAKCGRFGHGFLRVRCESCHHEKWVAFSCKRRGFCPSCGARCMVDSAAHRLDEGLPKRPMRQRVLECTVPLALPGRPHLFATNPQVMSRVLSIVHRVISTKIQIVQNEYSQQKMCPNPDFRRPNTWLAQWKYGLFFLYRFSLFFNNHNFNI